MKILHTADWHLGKKLEFFSRMDEQAAVLAEICEIAVHEAVDVVVIAGDIFDNFNPSNEATELLYKTLKKLSNNGQRLIIAIAGNHDSPDRIDMPDSLAKALGIFFIGYPNASIPLTTLDTGLAVIASDKGFASFKLPQYSYPLRCLLTPYPNEIRLKTYLGEQKKEMALNEWLKTHWQLLADTYCDDNGCNIAIAHLFMQSSHGTPQTEPEGERSIIVGNASVVPAHYMPTQIQYTALGHLHNFQNIHTDEQPIVYSSSPLAYSFAETGQEKKVVIVDIVPGMPASYKTIALHKGRKLYRKTFENVTAAQTWLLANQNILVEVSILTDTYLSNTALKDLYAANDGIIHIIPLLKNELSEELAQSSTHQISLPIEEYFKQFFFSEKKILPSDEIMDLFNEILNNTLENE